jgi:hypothetical protein
MPGKQFYLIILILFYPLWVSSQNNHANSKSDQIPFRLTNNKTIIPVKVGDSRELKIILDSGMGWDGLLIMNPGLKDSIKLINPREANLGGAGSGNPQPAFFSDSMSFIINKTEFKNQRIVVLTSDHYKGIRNDGVTGYSLFGHYLIEIDYDNMTISLFPPGQKTIDYAWTEIPVTFNERNIPCIDVKVSIEGETPVTLYCYIDYASSESIELLIKPDQKYSLPEVTEEYYLGRGLSGDIYGKRGKISKVVIGPYELKNLFAAFAPAEVRSRQRGADAVVANNLLRRFNLIFDYSNKKFYIKPNSHFDGQF